MACMGKRLVLLFNTGHKVIWTEYSSGMGEPPSPTPLPWSLFPDPSLGEETRRDASEGTVLDTQVRCSLEAAGRARESSRHRCGVGVGKVNICSCSFEVEELFVLNYVLSSSAA